MQAGTMMLVATVAEDDARRNLSGHVATHAEADVHGNDGLRAGKGIPGIFDAPDDEGLLGSVPVEYVRAG